jgi:hypothetical protein
MAQLPPDGDWLIQQVGGEVIIFQQISEREIARWDVTDGDATARAQKIIYESDLLTDEAKCFAHFWSGYFYAYSRVNAEAPTFSQVSLDDEV